MSNNRAHSSILALVIFALLIGSVVTAALVVLDTQVEFSEEELEEANRKVADGTTDQPLMTPGIALILVVLAAIVTSVFGRSDKNDQE